MDNKILTVFTPTYNRLRTLRRTYESLARQSDSRFCWIIIDDGSTDGTREWVKSLGTVVKSSGIAFDWMGCPISRDDQNHFVISTDLVDIDGTLTIEYVYKPNGGLFSGYNAAIHLTNTELCVCIDSDDYMPENAVERIIEFWKTNGGSNYAGIDGLDLNLKTGKPIGGLFPENLHSDFLHNISLRKDHCGDVKLVLRTDLLKSVAPMIGFRGEKNFNPVYLILQVCDKLPILIMNEILCIVDYQYGIDSMSEAICRQYQDSPRSFAKLRLLEMSLEHNSFKDRLRSAIHYVSSCLFYRNSNWLMDANHKLLVLMATPMGLLLNAYIRLKNKSFLTKVCANE